MFAYEVYKYVKMKVFKTLTRIYLNLLLLVFAYFMLPFSAFATHQRAGEITYRSLSNLTYEVTITTYTYAPSPADRCELEINWGDGESSILPRSNGSSGVSPNGHTCDHIGEMISSEIRFNVYIGIHTYPSASIYKIWLEDPNRNMGIENIPNSVDVPLFIESLLVINPFLGSNSSPILLNPPIDNGCIGTPYMHNPGAFDPNGDSLAYKLVTPKGAGGLNIIGYKLPNLVDDQNPGTFTLNEQTGDIIWESPTIQGEYNFAIIIEEWRNGIRIGYVTRDMQVNIIACDNKPPVLNLISDTCVVAGDTLRVKVSAFDPDNDLLTLTASGGPFLLAVSPASFDVPDDSTGTISATFVWPTVCSHVRNQLYQVYFKVTDDGKPVKLFDMKILNIKVIAPPIIGTQAEPLGNNINLTWLKPSCTEAKGYKIYRRAGHSNYFPDYCTTGVPPGTGYKLIAITQGMNTTAYTDNNNGIGLVRGITYCYIVTYWFEDGAESRASEEFCAALKKDLPVITNVTVDATSLTDGRISVVWSKPTELDTIQVPGPYRYKVYRSRNFSTAAQVEIAQFNDLNDTIYNDIGLNTLDNPWTYTIELINNTPGNVFSVGFSVPASSIFLTTIPSDQQITININENVPWANEQYTVYRRLQGATIFDSLTTISVRRFIDTALVNESQYCYLVKTIGTYGTPGYIDPLINFSQIKCDSPIDNIPPCVPLLQANINCDELTALFSWENIKLTCAPDIANYYLYKTGHPVELIATISPEKTSFLYTADQTLTGCFFVIASDTNGNIDTSSYQLYCIDIDDCPRYHLPNVFTPNFDNINDYFVPFPGYSSVERVEMQIFNRWGVLVYETDDPEIKWDGKDKNTNKMCPEGVYFYKCTIYEIVGLPELPEEATIQSRVLTNSIHLLR